MSVSRYAALATEPICGNTALDPDSEARVRALREQAGDAADMGCQRVIGWLHAYRCLECGRWMHAECLRQHFAEHGDRTAALERELGEIRRAFAWYMDGQIVGDMTPERAVGVWDDVRDKLGVVVSD